MSVKRFNIEIWLDSNWYVMAALQWRLLKVEREAGTYTHSLEYICWFVVVLPAPSTLINTSCQHAALNNSRVLIMKHSSIAFWAMSVWFVCVDLLHLEGHLSAAFVNKNYAGFGLSRSDKWEVRRMTAWSVQAFTFGQKEQKCEMLDFHTEELSLIRLILLCLGLRGVFLMSNDSSAILFLI